MNSNPILKKIYSKNFGRNLLMFIVGTLIGAFAFNLFFLNYNIVPTGSSGLAMLINNYFKIDTSLLVFITLLVFMLIGLISFGYNYALKMLLSTLIYPVFVSFTFLITSHIDLEDTSLFLLMIIGGAMMGLSSGLIRKSGYSPGGFCVIFDLMSKYFKISIGVSSFIVNMIIILCSYFLYGVESVIYALISLYISSVIVDRVLIGISANKVFYIVTSKAEEICEYITDNLHYSVTILKVKGGYSNEKGMMLMCVLPTIEYVKLRELVKEIDPKVFFLIVDSYDTSVKKICKNL